MPKPSIVFVPGSFAPPALYDDIFHAVTAKGYEIKGLHYPSIGLATGPVGEPTTMYADAAFIAAEVTRLADEGKDVILVAHSYGGIPTAESTKGLTKEERQKQGKPGGIVRLAYMTVLQPPVGSSATDILAGNSEEKTVKFKFDEKGWMYFADVPSASLIIISDLPDKEERERLTRKFTSHSSISFSNQLTHARYKDIPVSYLFCEGDICIPPKVQREGIDMIERESSNKVDVTYIKAGHHPIATAPQEVIDWILREAGKHGDL